MYVGILAMIHVWRTEHKLQYLVLSLAIQIPGIEVRPSGLKDNMRLPTEPPHCPSSTKF